MRLSGTCSVERSPFWENSFIQSSQGNFECHERRVQRIGENQTINVFFVETMSVCGCLQMFGMEKNQEFHNFVRHDLSVWPRPYIEL